LIPLFSWPQAGLAAVVGAHNMLNVSKQQQKVRETKFENPQQFPQNTQYHRGYYCRDCITSVYFSDISAGRKG